jgi:deoxyribodipyrimidine photolyase-related protein
VEYLESVEKSHNQFIKNIISKNKITQIRIFNPIEKELEKLVDTGNLIKSVKLEYIKFPSVYFLNSANFESNTEIQNTLSTTRHDLFYKYQRTKFNIMVKKVKDKVVPEGSKWSFDTENREKFPKDQKEPPIPEYKSKSRDEYIDEAIKYVEKNFSKHYGLATKENFIYPIDHEEATKWLDQFVKVKLDKFGKFEDAMASNIDFGYHSLLAALNNVGLITTFQILKKVSGYKKNIASKEGFIRQLIGWREYCYYVYDKYYDTLVQDSIYNTIHNKHDIPKKVWEGETLIPIIDDIIKKVNTYAYSHHIERLMGIGNFLNLIGVKPDSIYFWFQSMYIDAYDVFMVPNVDGMLLYSKAGANRMMTRPYYCSSNYLMKMSNYKSTEITFGNTTCKWDEVFDALYYNLINNYSSQYKQIYASASAVSRWNNFSLSKKKELLELSKKYIQWIYS